MFVLTEQLHGDEDSDPREPWRRYREYLEQNKARFPRSAWRLATGAMSDGAHPSFPHDAWLEWARFEEPARGKRQHLRHLNLRVRLLGPHHDRYIELFYPKVYAYVMECPTAKSGHFDWRYSELRLGTVRDSVVHEIEWAGAPGVGAKWLIEASDVRMRTFLIRPGPRR